MDLPENPATEREMLPHNLAWQATLANPLDDDCFQAAPFDYDWSLDE